MIFFALILHHIDILLHRQGVGFDAAELFHGRYLLGHELKAKTSACTNVCEPWIAVKQFASIYAWHRCMYVESISISVYSDSNYI